MRRKKWTRKSINSSGEALTPRLRLVVRRTSLHAIRITRYGRPGGHVRDRLPGPALATGGSWSIWPPAGVNFAGIAARATLLPGCYCPP